MAGARRPGRNFLFVPGPTNIPDRILRAMNVPMEDHRSSAFPKLTVPLYEGMKKVYNGNQWYREVPKRPRNAPQGEVTPEELGARWNPG